jgi:UDP-N-acetylglucosamine--N-acetylmuramyl-(pentapeptide) pyrophosphoryl-undecaprenol N-acetylglucosamine transferase
VILCYGGSLGAEKINDAGIDIATNLIRFRSDVRLILGTGKKAYYDVCDKIKEKRLDKLENFSVFEYIHDMPSKMAIADVVICRAGAMTISELASMKKCAVLVPSPNVANNHQLKNARVLEEKNAAKIITEDKLYLITDTIKELLNDAKEREKMENNIANFSSKDANKKIYEIINDLISNIE